MFFLALAAPATGWAATSPLRRSQQCILVVAANWNSTTGVLRAFERADKNAPWKAHGRAIPVVLGKKGLAWGRGLADAPFPGPVKKEGDNKAPAGIFKLARAFGYAPAQSAGWVKLPYLPLTKQIEGIDDPRSRYYNRLVDRSKVARVDWHSSERMRRDDVLYKWGAVVEHNPSAQPGAGSCIFLHIWKNSSTATTGCTAMPERDLVELLHWLDPVAHPVLVQVPRNNYPVFQANFGLPLLR
ncbi:MAG: L,D-transpeptidase family protein [Chthoniobacterales bacterium]